MANIAFDISSALYVEGAQNGITPDKNGVYRNFPIMVLGKVSRNNKEYEVSSMVEALTSPSSIFFKKLKMGQLQGEYGHPLVLTEKDLPRIAVVDPTKVSHAIHNVKCGETTEKGYRIVYADIEPCGPYGKYLKESLDNPRMNTAFSLRSLVAKIGTSGNIIKQRVTALITIDAVDAPGYAEASKVRVPSMEGMSLDIEHPENHLEELAVACGCESVDDQQLLDALQVNKVEIRHQINGIVDQFGRVLKTTDGKKSIFHEMF
jgi:hypothetical protein